MAYQISILYINNHPINMIRLHQHTEYIIMEIKLTLPHDSVFAFLQKKGYEIKPWLYCFYDDSFPNGKTYHEKWTFTATKANQSQSEETLFLTVFEKEIKEIMQFDG